MVAILVILTPLIYVSSLRPARLGLSKNEIQTTMQLARTQDKVVAAFGPPHYKEQLDSGEIMWTYRNSIKNDNNLDRPVSVMIFFKNNEVTTYLTHEK